MNNIVSTLMVSFENCFKNIKPIFIPDGLGVRIPDSHSGGPGSIPGQGVLFLKINDQMLVK